MLGSRRLLGDGRSAPLKQTTDGPPCRVKYVSSEETCEGYARIAASLTKHTNTGNRLSFKRRHSRKA